MNNKPTSLSPDIVRAVIQLDMLARRLTPPRDPSANGADALVKHFEAIWAQAPHTEIAIAVESLINGLNPDQRAEFAALVWIGAHDADASAFASHVSRARKHEVDGRGFAVYLTGKPLAEYLSKAYAMAWPDAEPLEP